MKLKNKRIYKFYLSSILQIVFSVILTFLSFQIIKYILDVVYRNYEDALAVLIWNTWREVNGTIIGYLLFFITMLIMFCFYYILISYRRVNGIVNIIEQTEVMAGGQLNNTIEVKANGDIRALAHNINSIATQLKEVSEKEKNAQKTKSDLITNVSHDLRTPLTSIMGYLEIIDNDKYKDEVELRYYANIAYEKSKILKLLINDLFELTKMQNNSITLNLKEINLVELLGQISVQFGYQFMNAGMECRTKFSEVKFIIEADPLKLVRAFENLLSNSIKYGKDGHYVDIKTKEQDGMAVVQIIDYGEPIPAVDLPCIFDRFYRVEKSRNSAIAGSGLGLAIAKNIIELHKGNIEAFSDENSTIFQVKLPIYNKEESEATVNQT